MLIPKLQYRVYPDSGHHGPELEQSYANTKLSLKPQEPQALLTLAVTNVFLGRLPMSRVRTAHSSRLTIIIIIIILILIIK
jgi:hypothetical protein